MVNRSWTALEFLADPAQLVNEFSALGDGGIGLIDFFESILQLGRDVCSAIFAKVALGIWIFFNIVIIAIL